MSRTERWLTRSARPEPLRKSASQQAYGRRGRALLTHPAHRPSAPERTFDVLRRPDIFTCYRQRAIPRLGGRALLLDLGRHDADRVRDHERHVALLALQRGPDVLGQGLLGHVEKRRPERFVTHGWTSSVPGR